MKTPKLQPMPVAPLDPDRQEGFGNLKKRYAGLFKSVYTSPMGIPPNGGKTQLGA